MDQSIPVSTFQFCHFNMKAAINKTQMNEPGCVPVKCVYQNRQWPYIACGSQSINSCCRHIILYTLLILFSPFLSTSISFIFLSLTPDLSLTLLAPAEFQHLTLQTTQAHSYRSREKASMPHRTSGLPAGTEWRLQWSVKFCVSFCY